MNICFSLILISVIIASNAEDSYVLKKKEIAPQSSDEKLVNHDVNAVQDGDVQTERIDQKNEALSQSFEDLQKKPENSHQELSPESREDHTSNEIVEEDRTLVKDPLLPNTYEENDDVPKKKTSLPVEKQQTLYKKSLVIPSSEDVSPYTISPLRKAPLLPAWEEENNEQMVLENESHSLTVIIQALGEECYFASIEEGASANIEYGVRSVRANDGGYISLIVTIHSLNGTLLQEFRGKRSAFYRYFSKEESTIQICLDNSGHKEKVSVILDVLTLKPYLRKVKKDGVHFLNKVKFNVFRGQHQLFLFISRRAIDVQRMMALANMIDTWSFLHLLLIVCCSIVQAVILKKFFSQAHFKKLRARV